MHEETVQACRDGEGRFPPPPAPLLPSITRSPIKSQTASVNTSCPAVCTAAKLAGFGAVPYVGLDPELKLLT